MPADRELSLSQSVSPGPVDFHALTREHTPRTSEAIALAGDLRSMRFVLSGGLAHQQRQTSGALDGSWKRASCSCRANRRPGPPRRCAPCQGSGPAVRSLILSEHRWPTPPACRGQRLTWRPVSSGRCPTTSGRPLRPTSPNVPVSGVPGESPGRSGGIVRVSRGGSAGRGGGLSRPAPSPGPRH